MNRLKTWILSGSLLLVHALVLAQSNPIDANRRVDWAQAGVAGGIPDRTTVCASLTPSNTLAQINAAIAACPSGQVVSFAAGTYNLTSGIVVNGRNNITLRGAGPDKTFFVFAGQDECGGLGGAICLRASQLNYVDGPGNVRNWTAGYSKGTTVITLDSTANLQVGSILMLDQVNDSTTDNGRIWICRTGPVCCIDCATPSRSSGGTRSQVQATRVTAISGNQVTISPGVIWPNFDAARSAQAWYASGPALTGVGVENLSVDTEAAGNGRGGSVFLYNVKDSWIKNVRVVHCLNKCVWMYQSVGVTVRDSYFYDKYGSDASQEGSESYGVNAYLSSMWLTQNNIFHHITSPTQCESGVGGVVAYNYSFDDFYNLRDPDWAQASQYIHGTCAYMLFEGNSGFGMIQDNVHGQSYFVTAFRNRWDGWESGKALQTVPVHIYASNRYANIVGNVLGTTGYHTNYESYPGAAGSCDKSIYAMGFGGNCGNGNMANKPDVRTSAMRWGNFDVVTNSVRFVAGEVPSADAGFPNAVPGSQTLPASLYLASRPSWFPSSIAYPPIGPDVSGGTVAGVGGRAHKIPARVCYEGTTQQNGVLNFSALSCYGVDAPLSVLQAPTNLRVIN
jgi:hypothetical protein